MVNKESLENFNETKAMLRETVKPVYAACMSLINHKPREELFYYLFPVFLLLLSAKLGEKCWLKTNACLSLLYGAVMFFFPEFLMGITFSGDIDVGMKFTASLYGCYQIGSIFFPLFLMNSKDKSILISYYWSKIIENVLIVIDSWVTVHNGLRWNYKLLCYSTTSSVIITLGMLYFLMNTTHKRSQFHFRLFQVNRIAKLDFFCMMIAGLVMYAYPAQVLNSFGVPNSHEGHQLLARFSGIIVFAWSIQSFCCPSFLFEKDKKTFFQARLCQWFLELATFAYAYCCLKAFSLDALYVMIAGNLVWGAYTFYGYYLVSQVLGDYQNQVEISILESEASFNNQSRIQSEPSEQGSEEEEIKKNE